MTPWACHLYAGLLEPPADLDARVIGDSGLSGEYNVTWSMPHTLDIPGDTLAYNITVEDTMSQEIVETTNSTLNEYHFIFGRCCQLRSYAVRVAGVNGLGAGDFSDLSLLVFGCELINVAACILWFPKRPYL